MTVITQILGLFLLVAGNTLAAQDGPQYIPRPYLLGVATPPSPTAFESSLLLASPANALYKQIGSAPYKPIGQSSAVSYCQDLMFIVGWNRKHQTTALLGFNTTTGDLIHEIKLPFWQPSGKNYSTTAGVARDGRSNYFVFGMENENGPLVGAFLNWNKHTLENKIVIAHDTSFEDFGWSNSSVVTYFPAVESFIVGVQGSHRRYFAVNMQKSSVEEFGTGNFIDVVDLEIDAERNNMVGIGTLHTKYEHTLNVTVLSLSKDLKFEPKFSLQVYDGFGEIGPFTIAPDAATMYWNQLGFMGRADLHLHQNARVGYLPRSQAKIKALEYFGDRPTCP